MSALYSVTHVKTETKPFYFSEKDSGFRESIGPNLRILAPLYNSIKGEFPEYDHNDIGDFYPWFKIELTKATDTILKEIIALAIDGIPYNCNPSEILIKMEIPGFNLWEFCVLEKTEDALSLGRDILMLQGVLCDAFPRRFAPPTLACVELYGFEIHPDIDSFKVKDQAMAVRLLTETNDQHPLYDFFPEPIEEDYDSMMDVIFRIEEYKDKNETYAIWLPVHLSGNIKNNFTWDSTAFPY
ncbi:MULTISPECIES: hypothetical protein [Aquimarina]|uniref:hypothetical protein n=1 Tax=Aquimarina TaxID=290174 RepID=UPI000942D8EA|nr:MULTISPECIES: hypothetical protein [Aquimarina]